MAKEERRLPRILRSGGHDRVLIGSGGFRVPVAERPRKRSSGETDADAGADYLEPSDSFATNGYRGQVIHVALFPSGGGGEPLYGWYGDGRFHGVRWMDLLARF